ASFVSLSGVFGGTLAGLGFALWGDAMPLQKVKLGYDVAAPPFVGSQKLKRLMSSWGGMDALFPRPSGSEAQALVQLPSAFRGNLTDEDLQEVLSE
ncbi:unnamed protein product, partial [Polarella glacialis]